MENQTIETRRTADFNAEFAGLPVEARTVIDDQDYQRRVYDLGPNLSVTFRGRDELPTVGSNEFNDQRPSILLTPDELPHVVEQDEFSDYVASHQDTESENKNLIVNATPVGIIDLVHKLSGEESMSSERSEMRTNFLSGKVGDKENAVLDMMSTAFVGIEYGDPLAVSDGYMDVALALAGDIEKRKLIHEKARILAEQEHGLVAKELGEDALVLVYEHEPLDQASIEIAKTLVLVRTTNNLPIVQENGSIQMFPAAEYTREFRGKDGKTFVPRQTTHFALNHHVKNHDQGNFDNKGYVIVAPLLSVLESGQRPTSLAGVDTYFTTSPGEAVELKDAIIISASDEQKEFIQKEGINWTYKKVGFKDSDSELVASECVEGAFKGIRSGELNRIFITELVYFDLVSANGLSSGVDAEGFDIDKIQIPAIDSVYNLDFLSTYHKVFGSNNNIDKLDQVMGALIKDIAVSLAIKEQGGNVVQSSGTGNYVEDDGFNNKVYELAGSMHVKTEQHGDSIDGIIGGLAQKVLKSNEMISGSGRFDWEDSDSHKGQQLNNEMTSEECTHRLRRATINDGIVSVRNEGEKEMRDRESKRIPGLII